MPELETKYQWTPPVDPSEPPPFVPEPEYDPNILNLPPMSPAREWLYEHRRLDMKPYIDFTTPVNPTVRSGLERLYPGVADKITRSYQAGYTDNQIMSIIIEKVDQSLKVGYSDGQIEEILYRGYKDYGFWERPLSSFLYGRSENVLEKTYDYAGTTPDYNKSPIRHELRAIIERGISGFTGGLSDAIQEEAAYPKSIPGTIAGSAANLVGFLLGPRKLAKQIIGGRLAPTATGLKGVAQVMTEGGATLGLASGIARIIPALAESPDNTEAAVKILESTGIGALTGFLYPLAGVVPTKPLRMAVGLAALDLIRNKGEFTIDDVMAGVVDGTIDREELANRSFGYLMDLYFLSKVKSMRDQLIGLEKNAMIKRMLELKPDEIESVIIDLRKGQLIPGDPERFMAGIGKWDKITVFGNIKDFNQTYKSLHIQSARLAQIIQADIEGKAKFRIPKDLAALAQKARGFRKSVNFANTLRNKLSETEKTVLQEITKGDLKRFWEGVRDRDLLEKQSMIQHKSQMEKIYDAMKTEIMFNKADRELQRLNDGKIRRAYQATARALWDTSANIKKDLLKKGGDMGKEAVIRHDLVRGAGPKSDRMIQEASKRIYGDLTKSEQTILDRIIQSKRTIAIEKYRADIKHPAGLALKEHQAYLDTLPRDVFMKLNERANLYFAEMRNQTLQLLKAGIISRESAAGLIEKGDYSPRNFIQWLDPERTYTFGGKKITVWDSGIKALDEGSYRMLENNSRQLLSQVVNRTQARIFRNEANRALYELAKQLPDNKVVSLAKVKEVTKKGKTVYAKTPAGYEKFGVMIDGQYREMNMPSGLAREWISQDPAISSQMANIIGWVSGAKILRPMATGINPEFALTNLPRDIAHAWITTYEYSPHLPVAVVQMAREYGKVLPETLGFHPIKGAKAFLTGKDYKTVWQDTFNRSGAWQDYINEGGGMSFLTHQGRITKKGIGKLSSFQNVLGYLGESSEIWTRLALRSRALRNGKPPHEATWIARNYIDFSQGGWLTKGTNTGVPYLNAGVQGTRGIVRAAKEKPGTFVYKVAEVGALATGIYLANKHTNPECWDAVSPHDKSGYFIITTPLTYTDEEGNTRHLYFRIAKDQGQRLIASLFENMMAKSLGEEIDVDQITEAAQDLISIMPTDLLPPTMDAMLGYFANKDFWRNEDIWKGPEIIPSEEYRAYTHPAFVKLGELTGMSPERARYALQQYFTYGNIYTSLVGGGFRQILDKLPEDVKEQTTQDMLRQAPFLRRVLRATDPYTQYAKQVQETKLEESTRVYKQIRTLDALSEQFYADQIPQKQVQRFISKQPWQDRARLLERHRDYGRLHEIPDKRWWLNLMGMTPEPRATVYWLRWQQANNAERKQLDRQMRKVPGITTERFMLRLNQLKAKK